MTGSAAPHRHATAVVVGAGDYIGAAVAKRFAAEGYAVVAGRRNADKLAPLAAEIEAAGGPGDARLNEPDLLMRPESIATAYWNLHQQTRDAWTFETDLRPSAERW